MWLQSTQDIYGLYNNTDAADAPSTESYPVRLPRILGPDDLDTYEYACINPEREIRLLELLPPSKAQKHSKELLKCRLHTYVLSNAPKYEALSYTWGVIERHLPISILSRSPHEGDVEEALFATPQLMMALRRLRLPTSSRLLWIDQLCIDQENSKEKGPQIQLMAHIYSNAEQVIIWLGEDQDYYYFRDESYINGQYSHLLSDTLLQLGFVEGNEQQYRSRAATLIDVQLGYFTDTIEQHRWNMIVDLLRRPWFSRAWVFQEASLAKQLNIQLGELEVDFREVKRLCDAVVCIGKDLGIHRDHSLAADTPGLEMMQLIERCRKERTQSNAIERIHAQSGSFLDILLQVLRRVRCYNQRDLIFAFLAFQNNEGIRATAEGYKRPTGEIWTHAAESIIKSSRSLNIFAALSGDNPRDMKLPSWVPYWADPFPFSRPIATSRTMFKASRDLPHVWEAHTDPEKLRVKGKIIDKVFGGSVYYQGPWFARGSSQGQMMEIFSMFDLMVDSYYRIYYDDDTVAEAHGVYTATKIQNLPRDMMRIILADGAMGTKQPLRDTVDDMLDIYSQGDAIRELRNTKSRHKMTTAEVQLVDMYELFEDLIQVAEHKIHFATEHFQHGLAPKGIEVGDCIAIIHGSRTPCVLRVVDEEKKEYRVLGQCYLDGWMYGKPRADVPKPHPHRKWWEEQSDEFVLV